MRSETERNRVPLNGTERGNCGSSLDTSCVTVDLRMSLSAWCARQRVSQSALAMRVGISASHLNQIARGRARPSSELAQRILAVIGSDPRVKRSADSLGTLPASTR